MGIGTREENTVSIRGGKSGDTLNSSEIVDETLFGGSTEHTKHEAEFREVQKKLLEITSALGRLNTSTEQGFLVVGSELRQVHTQTKHVTEELSAFMKNVSQSEDVQAVDGLRGISDRASHCIGTLDQLSGQAIAHLESLKTIVAELPDAVGEFHRFVSRLRMMGIATRIENARLGSSELGFEHLADAVSVLSEDLRTKTKEVLSNLKEIETIIGSNTGKLSGIKAQNQSIRSTIMHEMESNLQLLHEKHTLHTSTVESITEQSTKVLHDINAVIEAIQFHDITRQQIEHIIEALTEVQQHHSPSAFAEAILIGELQHEQLKNVAEKFDHAVLSIIYSLNDISETVDVIDDEARHLNELSSDSHETFLGIVEKRLGIVVTALNQSAGIIDEMSHDLKTIDTVIEKMQLFINEMSEIGTEIELLSINSRVKSAKVGLQGAGLGVIAESIQHISTTAHEHILRVVANIADLINISHAMIQDSNDTGAAANRQNTIHQMTNELNTIVRTFHEMNSTGVALYQKTETTSAELSKQLYRMMAAIKEQQSTTASLIQVIESLEGVVKSQMHRITDADRMEVQGTIDALKQRYTMEKEREVHNTVLLGESSNDRIIHETTESELGNNVELF